MYVTRTSRSGRSAPGGGITVRAFRAWLTPRAARRRPSRPSVGRAAASLPSRQVHAPCAPVRQGRPEAGHARRAGGLTHSALRTDRPCVTPATGINGSAALVMCWQPGTERESVDASTCPRARGAWFNSRTLSAKCTPSALGPNRKSAANGCRQRRAAKTRATTSALDSDAAARRRRLLRAARAASRTASGLLARARASRLRPLSQPNHVHLQAVGGLTIRERKLHAHHTHRGREANSWRRSRQRRLRAGATG